MVSGRTILGSCEKSQTRTESERLGHPGSFTRPWGITPWVHWGSINVYVMGTGFFAGLRTTGAIKVSIAALAAFIVAFVDDHMIVCAEIKH
jgi:hypothetical protein